MSEHGLAGSGLAVRRGLCGGVLGTLLLLVGCSSPTPPDPAGDVAAKYPYLAGEHYGWSDVPGTADSYPSSLGRPWQGIKLAALGAPSDNDLSDLSYTSATSGYGPLEYDRSNNTRLANDGQTLTIGGATFAKGLGVHANSEVTYTLGGACTTFQAQIGIDGEVGVRGSVVFQVWDGTTAKLFDSGVVRGGSAALSINLDISGVQNLRLVVTDGGDGISYDHADWAEAKVACAAQQPSGESFLSDLEPLTASSGYGPYERDRSNGERPAGDGQPLTIGGQVYPKGLGVHAASQLVYDLGGQCSVFSAAVGVDDEIDRRGVGSVRFQVRGDDAVLFDSGVLTSADAPLPISLNVANRQRLTLIVSDGGNGPAYDHADWANAKVTCAVSAPPLPPGGVRINFQPAASAVPAGYLADTGAAYSAERGYGWIREGSPSTPLDITPNSRDRALAGVDAQLNTFLHMQFPASVPNAAAVRVPAAWEYALPSGFYSVTVSVGEASNSVDSQHQINVEGQLAVSSFVPTPSIKFKTVTWRANVTDGFLTIDAVGGSNTKIDYVVIQPGNRPSVRNLTPDNAQTLIPTTSAVAADLNLPSSAVDLSSLTPAAVQLIKVASGAVVPATLNTSGGGDVIVLKPTRELEANTAYRFDVSSSLKDLSGNAFLPLSTTFVTGASTTVSGVAFEQLAQANVPAKPYTSVEMGPDNKLYAATLTGEILRFGVLPDGSLTAPQTITSVVAANGGPRSIIGLKFDPVASADNLVLWISNNYFWDGKTSAPDWSGKITRLSGPDLATVQDYVVGLPRSSRDHQTNSIAFKPGENNALYVLQGSNSAMGAPDTAWSNRPERLLNAALLRIDLSRIVSPPLNVQTEAGGTYNPYAPGAPVTLYASGIRNAYDLVWHTNGQLYVPTNGSAAGGNAPGTPASLPAACANRPDGPYVSPFVAAINNVGTQRDYLFRVVQGGYYGHPNPQRCEWVLNGGNPTAGTDPAQVVEYPAGTLPDRNYRGFAYDFGEHASANGVIEEYTSAPTSALRNKLLAVRYSTGKDIIVLTPGGPNQDIVGAQTLITGLTNFSPSPLDITEDRTNGHLYVAQLDELTGSGKITLVRLKSAP